MRTPTRPSQTRVWAAAATYIGTVVGAGFASGQEVLQFFGLLGLWGLAGIAVAFSGFFLFGYLTVELGRRLGAKSHLPVLREVGGKYLSPVLDIVTTFFLFGALSAMIAGAGSVLEQEFGVPWLRGALFLAGLALITVLFGLRGVVTAVSTVVPFLIGGVIVVASAVLLVRGPILAPPPPSMKPVVPYWPLAGLTYVSYNIVMSVPVLAVLGSTMQGSRDSRQATLVGALGLGISLVLVFLAIVTSFPETANQEVPMARLASMVHPLGTPLYTAVFLAEVYTTAVANLYGFSVRLAGPDTARFKVAAVLSTALGVAAASAGFTNLVRVVYPLVGWAGSAFLIALVVNVFRRQK